MFSLPRGNAFFIQGGLMMHELKNNDKLSKLLEINKMLTKSFNLEFVLKTLVESADELIDISDTIILYLYDKKDHVLRVAEGVGIDIVPMRQIAFAPGESITGRTFSKKKPILFATKNEIQINMGNISKYNFNYYYQGVGKREVKSAFCVPLLYQNECLGVLVVDNFENEGEFTENDINIMKIIADQTSIAIVNSNLFRDLKEKNEELNHSIDIHKKFTKVILDGGGKEPIIKLLSRILKSEIGFNLSSYENDEKFVYPIIRGKETLGFIKFSRPIATFSPLEVVAVEHASTALALDLIKQNALYEKELHFKEEIFYQMLNVLSKNELNQMVNKYFDWDSDIALECIIVEGKKEPLWKPDATMDKEIFVRSIENICSTLYSKAFIFTKAYQTILIIPSTEVRISENIISAIENKWGTEKEIVYGIGRTTFINEIGESYKEAIEAVRYGKMLIDENIINYSKLGVERLWQKIDRTSLDFYVNDKLGPLLAMNKDYFTTLDKFIEMNKNHKKTAEILHIHPNTLYHRLKKMQQSLNVSFDDEINWLNLLVAFQIYVATNNNEQ